MALTELSQNSLKSEAVNESKIHISNAGTNGQYLQKQSGDTGGLTWADATSTTINNNANNRLITGSGTANTLEGESNLTFDGSTLEVKASAATANDLINAINVNAKTTGTAAAGVGTKMTFWGSMTGQDDVELGQIGFHNNNVSGAHGDFVVKTRPNGTSAERLRIRSSGSVGIGTSPSHLVHIKIDTGSGAVGTKVVIENAATDSVNNNVELYLKTGAGDFGFKHYNATESYIMVPDQLIINTNTANSAAQALHIDTSQNVKVSTGNLVIGTSGKGIDFSATADASAGSNINELFDDYEEGTFGALAGASMSSGTISYGTYTKIGRIVHVTYKFGSMVVANSGSTFYLTLPFPVDSNYNDSVGSLMIQHHDTDNHALHTYGYSSLLLLYQNNDDAAWEAHAGSDFNTGSSTTSGVISHTYITAS